MFIWDDRVKQVEGFKQFLSTHQERGRLKKFDVIFVRSIFVFLVGCSPTNSCLLQFEGDREMTVAEERNLVQEVVNDYAEQYPQEPVFAITEFIFYTGVKLDPESKNALLRIFPVPHTWIPKADHFTVSCSSFSCSFQ